VKIALYAVSQYLDRTGFGQAGCSLDQQMAIGQQGNQKPIHQGGLPDNSFGHVVLQGYNSRPQRSLVKGAISALLIHLSILYAFVLTVVAGWPGYTIRRNRSKLSSIPSARLKTRSWRARLPA
jgi:hypothetical protein